MRKTAFVPLAGSAVVLAGLLGGCSSHSSLFNRPRPDEFAVTRQAPLVVPPDFALTPPNPGAPRPQDVDASRQALDALFGGPAPRSAVETDTLGKAGPSSPAIRSTVGDPKTQTVPKGAGVRDILKTPEGSSAAAHAGTGQ
ncbi:hypothetical protein Y88_2191 [Novosphingobium nitrogenifigens DSM 19370]|uniref:DUF3035 domain-containing protein n=1 Tax=Novosphingobium nitrogenifigens DSM 19370 TaxID=983920 RepID=F1Z5D9_9SPHN|nr:DUF3035 domain-containing protein [Novosphingobium nitrogenifigens]EGD60317.1 hypothetical protein Y88_2191 [Novosphingobium nitrogenifigens DSM 19370]